MASDETITTRFPLQQEVVDYLVDSCTAVGADSDPRQQDHDMYCGDGSEAEDDHMGIWMSRLSIESSGSDANTESSDEKKKKAASEDDDSEDEDNDDVFTMDRSSYYYHCRSSGTARDSRLERAWEMRRCHCTSDGADSHSGGSSPCLVVRPRGGGAACMCMDMEEVRACRDLGLELPYDWTVEIPPGAFHGAVPPADASIGGDSPVRSWRISSPGDDPRDVKARLRVWAQAVALASASRLGS